MPRTELQVEEQDPRESADWFRRLPEHAQEDMRQRWKIAAGASRRQIERRKATEIRYLVEAVILFAVCEWMLVGLTISRLFLLVVPGVALGWICHKIRADRWRYPLVAVAFYVATYGLLGMYAPWHFVVFVCFASAIGFSHEMQRADGSE